ncbi:MAG: recombinase family protein [Actinomycetota bacterium]|nr:recombinase family protein [Actinomycetota bacterium]
MRRAGLYARISEDAEGRGLGVQRQTADGQDLIERKGWTLAATYVDNDVSATRGTVRPEYERLLADMVSGEIDAVVVWALDRLHRRPAELERFIAVAEQHGVALASVSGDHDLSTPDGRLYARMLGAVAAGEAEKISLRVRRQQQQNREQGRSFGGGIRPYGYATDRMTVVPHEAAIIRECAGRVLSGESLGEIVADLNRRRIQTVTQWLVKQQRDRGVTRKTKPSAWSRTSLRTILSRPRIAGLLTHKGEVVGPGAWEPILDRATFDELQTVLSDRSQANRRVSNTRRYLLSGIATCGTCGRGLQAGHQSGGKGLSYKCPTQRHVSRSMARVDEHVIRSYWEHWERVGQHTAEFAAQVQAADQITPEIARLRARLDEASEAYANDALSAEQLTTISRRLRERIETLEAQRPSPVTVPMPEMHGPSYEEWRAQFDAMTLSQQRFLLASDVVSLRVLRPARPGGNRFDPALIEVQWPDPPSMDMLLSNAEHVGAQTA